MGRSNMADERCLNLNIKGDKFSLTFGSIQNVGGTSDHSKLANLDAPDKHPIGAITNLENALDNKLDASGFLTNLEIQEILDTLCSV